MWWQKKLQTEVVVSSWHSLNVISRNLAFILRLAFSQNVFQDTDVCFSLLKGWDRRSFWSTFTERCVLYAFQSVEYQYHSLAHCYRTSYWNFTQHFPTYRIVVLERVAVIILYEANLENITIGGNTEESQKLWCLDMTGILWR